MNTKHFLLTLVLSTTVMTANAQKYIGGDISMLPAYEAAGSHYYDSNGKSISNVLTYLKDQGMNSMRVRLFVDPSKASAAHKGEGVRQDLEWVKTLGARIKAAGLHFLLDFHYSDTWTDPGKHSTPDAWKNMTVNQLKEQMYTYTKETLEALQAANAQPDAIQVGNELNVGQLWNTGKATPWNKTMAEFSNFLNYTKQAAKACRDACPQAKIVFHVAMSYTSTGNANNNSYIREWAQVLKDQSFDYDIMGISYYPYYHGPLTELQTLLTYMKTNFPEKKIQLVEAGYPHKWYPGDAKFDYKSTNPDTNEGQKKFTQDLITLLNGYDNVNGLYWWWPEANEYWRKAGAEQVTTGWYNMGLWDNENGKATPALYELKSFLNDPAGISEVRQSQTTTAPHKYLENGRIVISKGNRRYNTLGQSL